MVDLISLFIPFITLFIIMDPFAKIPHLLMLPKEIVKREEILRVPANKAVLIKLQS